MKADLHLHTVYSDGVYTPEELVSSAVAAGLDMIAVTDHDTVAGVAPAMLAAADKKLKVVCGIEVSAYDDGVKLHTLGYGMDIQSPVFTQFMQRLYDGARRRTEDIICKLNACGVKLKTEDAEKQRYSALSPIHSIHIARAAAAKGYANGDPYAFYMQYIAEGKCASSRLCRPTPDEAVRVITAAGGFASVAHPGRVLMPEGRFTALIGRLKSEGLVGIEGVYSTHTQWQTEYYKELARKFGLEVTGGSDSHYPNGAKKLGMPAFHPSESLQKLLEK